MRQSLSFARRIPRGESNFGFGLFQVLRVPVSVFPRLPEGATVNDGSSRSAELAKKLKPTRATLSTCLESDSFVFCEK